MTLRSSIAHRATEREHLARLTAEYEAKHGPVTTQPLRIGDAAPSWQAANVQKASRTTKGKAELRRESLRPVIESLAAKGMLLTEIAAETGTYSHLVRRVADEYGIEITKRRDRK